MSDLILAPPPSADALVDGDYRYWLTRTWSEGPRVCWIMLNPSTADADQDDPTIRRCIDFSKRWGYGSLKVVNLFALRTTDPTELYSVDASVGPDNEMHIADAMREASICVAAWGARGGHMDRDEAVQTLSHNFYRPLWCLGLTTAGKPQPRHPLYVAKLIELVRLAAPAPPTPEEEPE